ncbi:MAG: DUF5103 domain-containing protein [Sphingobacteriaceae bacterium]|nr:DUF5103 domain-containing protein [Sphingobacteriaceae bacterium]
MWEFSPALIEMNTGEQLELSFDDLDGDQKQYSLTFVHCNADWTPSDLMTMEYMDGFNDMNIINFSFSMNTLQKYTHYSIVFPTQSVKFIKSGNYVLYVYLNGDKKDLVLSRRFMIFENKLNIAASIRQTIGGDDQQNKQQLEFSVRYPGLNVINPAKDLKGYVGQNYRWDNLKGPIEPSFYAPNELNYSMNEAAVFNGGNEFRFFDMRSLRVLSERVKDIYKDEGSKNHVVLTHDEMRTTKAYIFQNDINGSFLIKNRDIKGNQDIEADYASVDFFLPYPNPETKGNFYIMGKLTDWRLNKNNKMTYNYSRLGYECKLYLKQGYYNYIYVLTKDGEKAADETLTEGNHWDTENDYTILVYYRQVGMYYDQLIAIKKMNSLKR